MRFRDKVAIATAAGHGIGRASVEILAAQGATVVAVDIVGERLEALTGATSNAPGAVRPRVVVPVMKAQGGGKIVNLASIAGRGRSIASSSAYAAAKGGINALTRKLAFELKPFGITVNAIAPSLTLTERIRPHWERRTPQERAAELERNSLRRVAEASDQAKVICFLASSDADFVNGVTIDVTGGA